MAVESRIDDDDDWFVGEDRILRFRFTDGDTEGIENWNMLFELFASRARPGTPPLFAVPAVGVARTLTTPALAEVTVPGDETLANGAGIFQFVLSRTDIGSRAVLGFGPASIRSAVRT